MSRHKRSTDFVIFLSSTQILESSWICVSFIKHKIRKTVYPNLRRFRKKVSFDLFGWTACWSKSFKADWSSWICMKALLLKRTSQQGEIELPPESKKLKSESDFWGHFLQGGRLSGSRLFSRTYLQVFCSNFEGLFDAGIWRRGPVTLAQNSLRSSLFYAWYLLLVWLWAGPVYQGKQVLPNPLHKRTICAKGDWALLCFMAKQIFLTTIQAIFLMSI